MISLRKTLDLVVLTVLSLLCTGVFALSQDRPFGPPPFGDKHVGGDVPIDERLTEAGMRGRGSRKPQPEERVVTKGRLAVSSEDRRTFAEFLRMPNTGLTRLLQPGKVGHQTTRTPGSGSYYSFANTTHFPGFGSDIRLQIGNLSVGFVGFGYGFLTDLGDVPLDEVALTDPRTTFVVSYKPAATFIEARTESLRFRQAVIINGITYQDTLPVEVSSTYLVRSINYGKQIFTSNRTSRGWKSGIRSDVLVAFKVVRKDADESVILAWRLLKKYSKPRLD